MNDSVPVFESKMREFRDRTRMFAELKWTKVSSQKYDKYKSFVDYFFALNEDDVLHFKAMIIDNHKVNYRKFSGGDKEIGFYKFYYQLLIHSFGKSYYQTKENQRFIVELDKRVSSYKLSDLKYFLNNGFNRLMNTTSSPFVSVKAVDSKKSELMQINDILIGSVGFIRNGLELNPKSRKAKIDLANYIMNKSKIRDYAKDTPRNQMNFSIWNFKLKT